MTIRARVLRVFGVVCASWMAGGCGGGAGERPPVAPGEATAAAAPAEAAPASPAAPEDPVASAVEAKRPALTACYEKARRANAALGRTTVTLGLRADDAGRVTNVDLQYVHKFDEDAKTCMRDAAFTVKLPPAPSRTVKVPVVFEAK